MAGLALIALLCFGGSAYLAVVASRSIARPLSTLADEADRLAAERLPAAVERAGSGEDGEPPPRVTVPPGASDEVRSVADALDRVQATAYRLATEQAQLRRGTGESLADLARRSQNLLRRQLGFITKLEGEETDPTGLANLFELDHLATRMRRNAESLLVLVGSASPRTWSQPLPVSDVIRAAVAEVEEYRRVTLRRVDDVLLSGAVVSGVAHMLAELVENGLSFSAPDVDVEIQGRLIGDRYLIAVVDQGVGMTADELAEANRRLRGEGDFLVAPARYLGHYVVGRLARDLGVGVELTPSPVTGTTARLFIPDALLATPPSIVAPAVAILESASALTADGRLRPVTVEYVTTAPFLPLQREAVDDRLLDDARGDRPLDEAQDNRLPSGTPGDWLLGGVVRSAADDPREAADDRLPRVANGREALDGRLPGAASNGFLPEAAAPDRTPNGLPRRQQRAHQKAQQKAEQKRPAPQEAGKPADHRPEHESAADPDQVRARLTAFRTGMHRGDA